MLYFEHNKFHNLINFIKSREKSLQSESNGDIRGIKLPVLDGKKPCSTEEKSLYNLAGKVLPTGHGCSQCSLLYQDRTCIGLLQQAIVKVIWRSESSIIGLISCC